MESVRADERETPQFLTIGHATRDLLPDGGWRLGGTVTFAALTAQRLGLRAAIVTSGTPELIARLSETLPGIAIKNVLSAEDTCFENIYTDGTRRQYLRGRAASLDLSHIPPAWRRAPTVLLAPLTREVDPALAAAFPQSLVAATPQGWLRSWDDTGFVSPIALNEATAALPHLRALILSREDLPPSTGTGDANGATDHGADNHTIEGADAEIARWARIVPLVAVTRGAAGALLLHEGGEPEAFAAYPAREVDPTGAGDVFAAAFLCHLHATDDPRAAVDFANRVAALSIEREGIEGIPTAAEISRRFSAG